MEARKISLVDMLTVLFRREFYLDMAVFVFVCVPAVMVVLFFCLKIDRFFNLNSFISWPYNLIFSSILFFSGALIIWRAYAYLVIVGEGSPCPQLGGTRKLVTSGPYALVRHPSVIGKLLGVIGLGVLFRAVFFTLVAIPVLFIWSAYYNRFIQEKGCEEKFKDEYFRYRKNVPMFIPRIKFIKLK